MKFIGLTMLSLLFCTGSAFSQIDVKDAFVKVYGTGKTFAVPDEVLMSYSIFTKDEALQEVRRKNKALAIESITFLKSINIPDRHIQTKYMNIQPVKENSRSLVISHYQATQTITVCLDDVETFEKVVDKLLGMGIMKINNPTFRSTTRPEKLEEAQNLALANAREEAQRMAAILGMRIGDPIEITDIPSSPRSSNTSAYETISADADFATANGIALGELVFKANVEVKFELLK